MAAVCMALFGSRALLDDPHLAAPDGERASAVASEIGSVATGPDDTTDRGLEVLSDALAYEPAPTDGGPAGVVTAGPTPDDTPDHTAPTDDGATGNGGTGSGGTGNVGTSPGDPGRPEGPTGPVDTASTEAAGAGSSPSGVVRFVYFVEADEPVDPQATELIATQARALQQFWYDQFGGTFHLPAGGVDIVYGAQPARWYDEEPNGDDPRWNRLMNIRAEVNEVLGIEADAAVRLVVYPSARIDGRVGANRYEGAWMDGDDLTCVTDQIATIPYSLDHPADCLATVAHELGHVYGLGHEGEDADCMQFGFYRYMSEGELCSFSPANRAKVASDPRNQGWLDALPGDER